jgi:hypothetical protein
MRGAWQCHCLALRWCLGACRHGAGELSLQVTVCAAFGVVAKFVARMLSFLPAFLVLVVGHTFSACISMYWMRQARHVACLVIVAHVVMHQICLRRIAGADHGMPQHSQPAQWPSGYVARLWLLCVQHQPMQICRRGGPCCVMYSFGCRNELACPVVAGANTRGCGILICYRDCAGIEPCRTCICRVATVVVWPQA